MINVYQLEMEDLGKTFEGHIGFLLVPGKKNRNPPCEFYGIVRECVPYKDERGQARNWFVIESSYSLGNVVTEDGEILAVQAGDRVGVSGSAAIRDLEQKIGHWVHLSFTGEFIKTKNGEMLEVEARVSKTPVPAGWVPAPLKSAAASPSSKMPSKAKTRASAPASADDAPF